MGYTDFRVLHLPGCQNPSVEHWSRQWERLYGDRLVEQDDWQWPRRGDWMVRLEETLLDSETPAVLVGHGLGCHLAVAWAAHSRQTRRVLAALLIAPLNTEGQDMSHHFFNWRYTSRQRLPFVSAAVISTDDPYCNSLHAAQMAADWGSELLSVGPCGHLDSESGLGEWLFGRSLLHALIASQGQISQGIGQNARPW